ncbi:hypothetical protein ILUMI_22997 [Ignelater luminosus]|uniref:Uncharacterized protein n=1 Tax=Ignelater luminosus TaxID=2038154 RepID=A0A8K0CG26_IGNLU|nr:hypothetical protein ILUMI_22997 [Ignelater luminosus]
MGENRPRCKFSPENKGENIKTALENIKKSITQTAEEVLGPKLTKKKNKQWFDEECQKTIKEKKQKWIWTSGEQELRNCTVKRKEATKLCKKNKEE